MKLYESGAYLINGTDIVADGADAAAQLKAKVGKEISRDEARKETIAYSILNSHNTSGNMDELKIKFDKLTSHDITFVGIYEDTSPACVSMIGNAVSEPPPLTSGLPFSSFASFKTGGKSFIWRATSSESMIFAARSSRRLCK